MTLSKVNIFSDIAKNVLLLVECLYTNKLKIDIPNNLIVGNAISKKEIINSFQNENVTTQRNLS